MASQIGNNQSPSFPIMFIIVLKDFFVWGLILVTMCRVLSGLVDLGFSSVLVAVGVLAASAALRKLSRWKSPVVEEFLSLDLMTDSFSGSERINPSTNVDSEAETELMFSEEGDGCGQNWSEDGSITDEESLIEIAISTGHYIGRGCSRNKKMVEINDVNEEENMIEIDVSVGSIKCNKS